MVIFEGHNAQHSLWHSDVEEEAAPNVGVNLVGYDAVYEDTCVHQYRPHVLAKH
jgi:hypothetical protein